MRRLRERYFRWLVRRRGPALGVLAAASALAAWGAARVPVDYSVEQFFPAWGEERRVYEEYRAHFPREDVRFSLFWRDRRPMGAAVYRDMARAVDAFREAGLTGFQWVGTAEVAETATVEGEPRLSIVPLVREGEPDGPSLRERLERHRDDPRFRGVLWNADQSVFAVHGYLDQARNHFQGRRAVERALTARLDSLRPPEASLVLSGIPVIRSRVPEMLERDQALFVVGGFLAFLAVLWLMLRHGGQVLLCLAPVAAGYVATLGLMALTGTAVTVLTSFIPVVVLVVGASDAVHLVAEFRREARASAGPREAVVRAFTSLSPACFYTSATTAVGFLSLAATRIGIVVDFGVFTAAAIVLTYLFGMSLLPVLLSLGGRHGGGRRPRTPAWIAATLAGAAALARRQARWVLPSVLAVAAAGALLSAGLRTNVFLVDDMKDDAPVVRDLRWIESQGFGLFQVNLYLRREGDRPLHGPEALAWMDRFARSARSDPLVVSAVGLPDVLGGLRAAVTGEAERLPATAEEASQLLFLAELGDGAGLEDLYRRTDGVAQVLVTVRDRGSAATLPFLDRMEARLREDPFPAGTARLTGTVQLVETFSAHLLRSFGPSLALALVGIAALMTWMFRSPRLGLLALLPNLLPLLVIAGALRLGGFDLKPSSVLVFSIAFGIAVDDTVHLLAAYRRARPTARSDGAAMATAIRRAGAGVLMSTVMVSAGFALLLLSRFEVLYLIGLLTVIGAWAAVGADLVVLPRLVTPPRGRPARSAAMTPGPVREPTPTMERPS